MGLVDLHKVKQARRGTTLEMIYPVSGLVIKRGGKPNARNMPGFASLFQKGEEKEDADETEEVEEAEDEEDEQEKAAEREVEQELGWVLRGNNLEMRRGYGQQVYRRRMAREMDSGGERHAAALVGRCWQISGTQ